MNDAEQERFDACMEMNRLAQEPHMHPAVQVYFRAGLLACREYMARFVESQDKAVAQSIRANWWPSLGDDPGPPRLHTWQELTEGEHGEPGFRCKGADEVSPSVEALPIAWHFLNGTMPGAAPAAEPKSVTITLNGRNVVAAMGEMLSYDEIARMARVTEPTITFMARGGQMHGSLVKGQAIGVVEGMHITAVFTGNA